MIVMFYKFLTSIALFCVNCVFFSSVQAAQASLARLTGRVAGADDPNAALHARQNSDLSRVALIAAGGVGGPEVRPYTGNQTLNKIKQTHARARAQHMV